MTPSDYLGLWSSCKLPTEPKKVKELETVCKIALANQPIYQTVEKFVSIPWPLIAALHFRESDQNFKRHLHNGDPLTNRTVHVPKDRPKNGVPPFTWIESAMDALSDVWRPFSWDVAGCLEFFESYNGLGYQKHGVNSPYVWNYTDKYESGLFTSDGVFSKSKIETRPGCVAIVKTLALKGVQLDFTRIATSDNSLH